MPLLRSSSRKRMPAQKWCANAQMKTISAELDERQVRDNACTLAEALLGRKRCVEQVEQPGGEREDQQRAGDPVQDRDPSR